MSKLLNITKMRKTHSNECSFCNILKNIENYKLKIFELNYGVLLLHKNQNFHGRCIYIIKNHKTDYTKLTEKDFLNFNKEILMVSSLLKKTFKPNMINLCLLGNKVEHIHWHIIPRYKDDSSWGFPPWPSKEKYLKEEEDYFKLISKIRSNFKKK